MERVGPHFTDFLLCVVVVVVVVASMSSSSSSSPSLTQEQVEQFDRDGYVVVRGALDAADLQAVQAASMAMIEQADVVTTQGAIHVLDQVLLPPFMTEKVTDVAQERFPTLLSLIVEAELEDTLASQFGITGTLRRFILRL